MEGYTCYVPITGLDDSIADYLNGGQEKGPFNKLRIAGLRAIYDDAHPNDKLDETFDSTESRSKALSDFLKVMRKRNRAGIITGTTHQRQVYKGLKRSFSSSEISNRANMIARMVMKKADDVAAVHPEKSRKKLYQGFSVDNIKKGGQFNFFESVYDELLTMMVQYEVLAKKESLSEDKRKECKERADKYRKMLEPNNWVALCVKARTQLLLFEGLKLGIKEGFAEYADSTEFDDYDNIEDLHDAEETNAEYWQENEIRKSAFGSIGKRVRRYLSGVRAFETKVIETESGDLKMKYDYAKDDLDFPIYLDPVEAHRKLLMLFTGIRTSKDILGRLLDKNGNPAEAWLAPIVRDLQKDPDLLSDFFVDFYKDMCLYTKITSKIMSNGVIKHFVYNLNKIKHNLYNEFSTRIKKGTVLSKNSVYDESGNVNWTNLQTARTLIKQYLVPSDVAVAAAKLEEKESKEEDSTKGGIFSPGSVRRRRARRRAISNFYSKDKSNDERAAFLAEISNMFGVDLDSSEAYSMLRNQIVLRDYTSVLLDLVEYGIDKAALVSEDLQKLEKGALSVRRSYRGLVETKGSNTSMKEKLSKMMDIIANIRGVSKAEPYARYKNRKDKGITLHSPISPSYMGDKFNEIKSYVQANDHAGLRDWIEKNFLESSFFYDKVEKKILNKWLADLYEAALDESTPLSDSFAAEFTYDRNLGSDDTVFENFTTKQHAIAMLTHFFDRPKGSTLAKFPVFVMGDSGASKYIRANIHSMDSIVDYMYDVYLQEKARMKQVDAFDRWLSEKAEEETGIKGYKYSGMSGNGKEVKAFLEGKDKFTFLTFLNKDNPEFGDKYSISKDASEAEIKTKIRNFMNDQAEVFYNRLQQFDVLETVNTADGIAYKNLGDWVTPANIKQRIAEFYFNTKFATIEQLQIMTLDPSFYASSEDLQKRYKEIHAPGLPIDIYAVDTYSKEHKGERVSDGWERAIYFDDIKINAERTNPEFMAAIENNSGTSKYYKTYVKNTLTDGQTYRSLDSFRALEIMSREWNKDKEAAYREILEIRRRGKLTPKDIDRLSKLAVSLMPKKPYLFTHEKIQLNKREVMYIPVQHKCSEAVLIPELLPEGSLLRALAVALEAPRKDGKKLDIAVSSKVVKVGEFGSTNFDNLAQYDGEIRKRLNLADDAEVSLQDRVNHAISLAYVHEFDYNDYRIQTNVPEHVYASRLFGTQIRKLMMSGVIKYKADGSIDETHFEHYVGGNLVQLGGKRGKVKLTGRNLVAFYNALITANILDTYDSFEEATSTNEAISNALIQNSVSSLRESQDNIIAYGLDENGNLGLPIFEAGLEHDSSGLLLSFFKKLVNKQTINGGSAVQESPFGLQDSREDGGLSYVAMTEDGREVRSVIEGDEVKFIDENGNEVNKDEITNIKYAEVEVPFDFKYTDADGVERELDYSEYCNADGTFILGTDGKTPKIEQDFPGILDMVTYRIPTEKEYSMINAKIVRCAPKLCGGTIKVPAQGTTIAGFDFDIDKLYFMRNEFIEEPHTSVLSVLMGKTRKNSERKWLTYSTEKSPLEQHKDRTIAHALRNNMLLNIIRQRLMDKSTFDSRYTPQGFEDSSTAARIMRDLELTDPNVFLNPDGTINFTKLYSMAKNEKSDPRPNFDCTDPYTLLVYNQQNQVASKLIGLFANQNANYAFSTLMKTFRLKKAIEFAGHTKLEGFGYDLLRSPEGRDNSRTVAEFLAASVDAVKDPTLNYLNLNTVTASAGALLARIGYNPTEIGLLFNQPIIKEACEMVFNESIRVNEAITNLKREYLGANSKDLPVASAGELSMNNLGKTLIKVRNKPKLLNEKTDRELVNQQLKVLELFNRIINASSELTEFINATRFTAANSVGSTFGALYAQQMRVSSYLEKFKEADASKAQAFTMEVSDFESPINTPVNDKFDVLDMSKQDYLDFIVDNPFGYEQAMFDMNRKAVRHLSKYYPYETPLYKSARERLKTLVRFSNVSGDLIDSWHRDLPCYLLSRQGRSLFNPKALYPGTNMTVSQYYGSSDGFIQDYSRKILTNTELQNHPMIQALEVIEGAVDPKTGKQTFYLTIPQSTYFKAFQKDVIKDAWEDLMKVDKQLALDLFFYCYHKNGMNFTSFSFLHLAPTALKEALPVPTEDRPNRTYKEFLQELLEGKYDADLEDFAQIYIRNHSNDKSLVYDIKNPSIAKNLKEIIGVDPETGRMPSSIKLDLDSSKLRNYSKPFEVKKVGESTIFVPAFKLGGSLYIAQGNGNHFNVSTGRSMTYIRVKSLGTENVSTTFEGIENAGEVIGDFTSMLSPVEAIGESKYPPLIINGFDFSDFDGGQSEYSEERKKFTDPDGAVRIAKKTLDMLIANADGRYSLDSKVSMLATEIHNLAWASGHPCTSLSIIKLLNTVKSDPDVVDSLISDLRSSLESDNPLKNLAEIVARNVNLVEGVDFTEFDGDTYRRNSESSGQQQGTQDEDDGYVSPEERLKIDTENSAISRLANAIASLYTEAGGEMKDRDANAWYGLIRGGLYAAKGSTYDSRMQGIQAIAEQLKHVCRDEKTKVPTLDENRKLTYLC